MAMPFLFRCAHDSSVPDQFTYLRFSSVPTPFGSLHLRWPRCRFRSVRLLSQLLHTFAMPIESNRFSSVSYRIASTRCHSRSDKVPSQHRQFCTFHPPALLCLILTSPFSSGSSRIRTILLRLGARQLDSLPLHAIASHAWLRPSSPRLSSALQIMTIYTMPYLLHAQRLLAMPLPHPSLPVLSSPSPGRLCHSHLCRCYSRLVESMSLTANAHSI